jgi:SAM-dependent methyltransferase
VNPAQLVVAKWHCAKCEHPAPIEYMETNAYDTELASRSLDIVHMRLLSCHLTDPLKVLAEAYRLLKPGGALVCQDLKLSKHLLLSGVFCLRALRSTRPRRGSQARSGLRFRCAIAGRGCRSGLSIDPDTSGAARLFGAGREKRLWEHTFAETVPVMVRTGVAIEDELKGLLEEMRETAKDESVFIAQACLPGVVAVKQRASSPVPVGSSPIRPEPGFMLQTIHFGLLL